MRLDKIIIANFQGLRHAALDLSAPVLLAAGPNGAGKSSLLDAVGLAMNASLRRVSQKKEAGQLVTEGAKGCSIDVLTTDQNYHVAITKGGKITDSAAGLEPHPALPFVLAADRFANLASQERRKLLFELTGASAKPEVIAQRLLERGASSAKVETIKVMLLSGFPAAAQQAKEHASEARGAWKAITGEAYGSQKAESWAPEQPPIEVSPADLDAAASELHVVERDLDEAQQALGSHKADRDAEAGRAARIIELKELASLVQRRQNKLNNDSADLQQWKDKLSAAEAATTGSKQGLIHDMARNLADWQALAKRSTGVSEGNLVTPWSVLVEMDHTNLLLDRYVTEYGQPAENSAEPDQDLAKRAQEFRTYVDNLTRAVDNDRRDLAAAEQAAAQLAELQACSANVPSVEAIANAEQVIIDLRQQRDRLRAKVESLRDALTTAQQFDQLKTAAAGHHRDVAEWSLIADALAPDGIPTEILASALDPANALLRDLAGMAGWRTVEITPDIEVSYGGRAYGLLAESERWRADALLALAIAELSGLRLVLLDRFDVLDLPSRNQLLGLLLKATRAGRIDTAIAAGTLKALPGPLPKGIQGVWIEGGVIGQPATEVAA